MNCADNCMTCDDVDCLACNEGWMTSGTPVVCVKCSDYCTECSTEGECDDTKCASDTYRDTNDGNKCKKCVDNCLTCESDTVCSTTAADYYVDSEGAP